MDAFDGNETIYKSTKKAYKSTNKHLPKIEPQLLIARANIEAEGGMDIAENSQVRSQLLISRQPVVLTERTTPDNEKTDTVTMIV